MLKELGTVRLRTFRITTYNDTLMLNILICSSFVIIDSFLLTCFSPASVMDDNLSGGDNSGGEPAADASADPLYDPDLDESDEAWMQAARQGRESDAILNCPCCFTTVCVDCQQHETSWHRFRAMFVMNCTIQRPQLKATEVNQQGTYQAA